MLENFVRESLAEFGLEKKFIKAEINSDNLFITFSSPLAVAQFNRQYDEILKVMRKNYAKNISNFKQNGIVFKRVGSLTKRS